ncbi:MAG: hypothetical protein NTV51_08355 [Verrucomicrobia bacterium]|nr:hypothetical protein [Verrucomicrobiota bacterium]
MKFTCPACQQSLPPGQINVQTDLALCQACGHVARLSQLVDADFDARVLHNPPKGAWYQQTMSEHVVGATTRHPSAFFLVPFMCVWSGGSLGGIYGTQIAQGKFNLTTSLFGIPFLLGSILFWTVALMAIWGKMEVRVRDGIGTVFVGLGRLGWKRSFNLDDVESIEDSGTKVSYPGSSGASIVLRGKSILRFGTNLTEPRRYFVLNVLKQLKARRRG